MIKDEYNQFIKQNAQVNIDKYLKTKTMQRLKGRGQFCGMDYVAIKELIPIEFYSRYDHSMNIAYTASKLIDELKVILAGLFHDVGTLSFAHVNSYKKGNIVMQDDELSVKHVLMQDEELLEYLHEDGIDLDDVVDAKRYPLIDKDIPCLCLDRVDGGVLGTCLFWAHTHTLEQIKDLYNMLCYMDNLNGMVVDVNNPRLQNFTGEVFINELGVNAYYEDFFQAINVYSRILLSKESRYIMEVLGATLRYYEDKGVIDDESLFNLSERENIEIIMDSKYRDVWRDIMSIDKVSYGSNGLSFVSKPKIRETNPLCFGSNGLTLIDGISGTFYQELNPLGDLIEKMDEPMTANLSKATVKALEIYRR